jgi:hypothetical protein
MNFFENATRLEASPRLAPILPRNTWGGKGTGFPPVKQPAQPGRKIYPARCERCDGKGWVTESN